MDFKLAAGGEGLLSVKWQKEYQDVERKQAREFPNHERLSDQGEVWWRVLYLDTKEWSLDGYIGRDGRLYDVTVYHPSDRDFIERTFLDIARSLRSTSPSRTAVHPIGGFRAEMPDGWNTLAIRRDDKSDSLEFRLLGRSGLFIYAYPVKSQFSNLSAVLSDITSYYEKRGVRSGSPQVLKFAEGDALWAEAPGTGWPFLGAVSRGGKYFFVSVEDSYREGLPGLKEAFLSVLRSVRP